MKTTYIFIKHHKSYGNKTLLVIYFMPQIYIQKSRASQPKCIFSTHIFVIQRAILYIASFVHSTEKHTCTTIKYFLYLYSLNTNVPINPTTLYSHRECHYQEVLLCWSGYDLVEERVSLWGGSLRFHILYSGYRSGNQLISCYLHDIAVSVPGHLYLQAFMLHAMMIIA